MERSVITSRDNVNVHPAGQARSATFHVPKGKFVPSSMLLSYFPSMALKFAFISRYFGQNCNQICKCKNFARCRKNDGYCICNDGWMGAHCEDVCPEGKPLRFNIQIPNAQLFFCLLHNAYRFLRQTLYGILFVPIATICVPRSPWMCVSCRILWHRLPYTSWWSSGTQWRYCIQIYMSEIQTISKASFQISFYAI